MRNLLQVVLVVAIVAIGAWASVIVGRTPPSPERPPVPPRPVQVAVATAERGDLPRSIRLLGDLMPARITTLRAEVAGTVQEVQGNTLGQSLGADEVVVRIDPRDFEIALEEAQAAEESARQTWKRHSISHDALAKEVELVRRLSELADAEVPRLAELLDESLIRPAEYEAAEQHAVTQRRLLATEEKNLRLLEQDIQVAASTRKMNAAIRSRAERNLEKTVITVPYPSALSTQFVEVGDRVVINSPLVEIQDLDTLRVEVAVPSSRIGLVELGAKAQVTERDALRTHQGSVTEIAPQADTRDRTFAVMVAIPNEGTPSLRPGPLVEVSIELAPLRDVLRVPEASLAYREGETVVFALDNERRFTKTAVRLLETVGKWSALEAGIPEGTQVASESLDLLFDGAIWLEPTP